MYIDFLGAALPPQEEQGFCDLCNEISFIVTSHFLGDPLFFLAPEGAHELIEEIESVLCYIPATMIDPAFRLVENRVLRAQEDIGGVFYDLLRREPYDKRAAIREHIAAISINKEGGDYEPIPLDFVMSSLLTGETKDLKAAIGLHIMQMSADIAAACYAPIRTERVYRNELVCAR